jgi:hypothetical protein
MRAEMMSIEDKIDPRKDFPLVRAIVLAPTAINVRTKILEPVYEYWIDKRKRLGKALMRQYQEPPPRGNTDPHVAFRPRTEGRRISKRNVRASPARSSANCKAVVVSYTCSCLSVLPSPSSLLAAS